VAGILQARAEGGAGSVTWVGPDGHSTLEREGGAGGGDGLVPGGPSALVSRGVRVVVVVMRGGRDPPRSSGRVLQAVVTWPGSRRTLRAHNERWEGGGGGDEVAGTLRTRAGGWCRQW